MRIKLLYPPGSHGSRADGAPLARIPLLGLPILKTILKEYGFRADIDDLDMRVHAHNESSKDPINMELFLDSERVRRHIAGETDDAIEEQVSAILKLTKTRGYDIIGFSVTDEVNYSCHASTLILSKMLREKTGCLTILGGSETSSLMRSFTTEDLLSCVDMVSFESPEECPWRLVDLAQALVDTNRKPEYPFKEGGIILNNYSYKMPRVLLGKRLTGIHPRLSGLPEREFGVKPLDTVMLPDFQGMPLEHYVTLPQDIRENFGVRRGILVLPYVFAVGCPSECAFCGCSAVKNSFHTKRPETIAEELATISKRYRTRYFVLMDTNINPTKTFTRRLIRELEERDMNLMLSDCANFRELDDKLLQGLYDVGVRRLIYGIESPNDKMLQYVEKGITLAHAKRILKRADRIGIWNEAEVICGMPFETPEIEEEILSFMKEFRTVINLYWVHKFKILHNKMKLYPHKYGLTNIRVPPEPDVQGWAFDEVGGLTWAEKYWQIQRSYHRAFKLGESLEQEAGYFKSEECSIRMYMLYSLLGKKKEVVRYMQTHFGLRRGG